MAGLAKLLGVRIYELNRSNLFVLFSLQMNFCGLRLGSALIGFFGRDPGLFSSSPPGARLSGGGCRKKLIWEALYTTT